MTSLYDQLKKTGKVLPPNLQDHISIDWKKKKLNPTQQELEESMGNLFKLERIIARRNGNGLNFPTKNRALSLPKARN